jgi:hypothetical protein
MQEQMLRLQIRSLFARVLIVTISMLSIAGVQMLCDQLSEERIPVVEVNNVIPSEIIPETNEKEKTSKEEISSVTKTFKKIVNVIQYKKFERSLTPIEQLELIKPENIITLLAENNAEPGIIAPHFNANAIYIYDLKVSDYNKLYFNRVKN